MDRIPSTVSRRVLVKAADSITQRGAVAVLRAHPAVSLVKPTEAATADVLLLIVPELNRHYVNLIQAMASDTDREHPLRVVLVAEQASTALLLTAIEHGLASVLLRSTASYDDIVHALLHCRGGEAQLPDTVVQSLITHLTPRGGGQAAQGLDTRETQVLRLLADGCTIRDIAARLSYSERTIKHVIHSSCTRLGLRNRTHAVAHAVRQGLI